MHNLKTRYLYGIIEDIYICDKCRIFSYGIFVISENLRIVQEIHGISENYNSIYNLVELCNSLKLDPIHINDVVEDFLINKIGK